MPAAQTTIVVTRDLLRHPPIFPPSLRIPIRVVSGVFGGGYVKVARFGAAPVRVHWTTPVGAFFFCGLFTEVAFAPAAWIAFFFLVLVHELGHAVLARRFGMRVTSIDVHGLGGMCRLSGQTSDVNRAKIAWGGVVAQALLLVATALAAPTHSGSHAVGQIVQTWTAVNVLVIAFNLLPFRGLDGAEAWLLFRWRNVRHYGRQTALEAKKRKLEKKLERLEGGAAGTRSKRDDRSMLN
jgi:Zn-dependent protease